MSLEHGSPVAGRLVFLSLLTGIVLAVAAIGAALAPTAPVEAAIFFGCAGLVLGAVAAAAGALAVERRRTARQLGDIADTVEALSAHDVVALADALADIAHGEPAPMLRIQATPVHVPGDPTLRRLADAVNTTVARLESSVEQFNIEASESCRRLFYLGPDDFLLGSICAEELARLVPPDGEILVLLGRFSHTGMELRRRGFESGLRDRRPDARIAAVFENRYDASLTYDFVRAFIRTHPRLGGIYSAEGVAVQGAARAVLEEGRTRDIAIVCHDLVEDTLPHIRSGVIAGTVTQDAFGQGFETPIHLFNHVAFGWHPPEQRLSTRMEFVTADTLDRFSSEETGLLDSSVPLSARVQPFGQARTPIRIAFLAIADNPFWRFVRAGSNAADDLLRQHGATIDWINAEGDGLGFESHRKHFELAVAGGYDAIASPVFETALVPFMNRAIDAGIPVATYNSEAASLGGLIAALTRQWRRLEATATRLEASATHDPLTGVFNRRAMETDLADLKVRVERGAANAALIMVDIDRFKPYNDKNGHIAGDQVLREVVVAIKRALRPADRVYRYGGEEFLVAIESVTEEGAITAAQRIVGSVQAMGIPHPENAPWGVVTVSAGVRAVSRGESLELALGEADAALFGAKVAGRNRAASPERPG